MSKKLGMFTSVSVLEVKKALKEQIEQETILFTSAKNSVERKSPARNLEAYKFALGLLVNMPENVVLEIPANHSLSFNIGAIGETVVKYFYTRDEKVRMATSIESDLNRSTMNEIKVWSSVNRNPNAMAQPYGFIAITRLGAYYINKQIVSKYWNDFSDKQGKKTISRKMIETIIEIEQPNKWLAMSEWLGL